MQGEVATNAAQAASMAWAYTGAGLGLGLAVIGAGSASAGSPRASRKGWPANRVLRSRSPVRPTFRCSFLKASRFSPKSSVC